MSKWSLNLITSQSSYWKTFSKNMNTSLLKTQRLSIKMLQSLCKMHGNTFFDKLQTLSNLTICLPLWFLSLRKLWWAWIGHMTNITSAPPRVLSRLIGVPGWLTIGSFWLFWYISYLWSRASFAGSKRRPAPTLWMWSFLTPWRSWKITWRICHRTHWPLVFCIIFKGY